MADHLSVEDSEPAERVPTGLLLVPVRSGPTGCAARFFRTPLGGRTAVCFTTEQRLIATLGADQEWISLSAPALRALAAPLGVPALTVDPQLSAPASVPVHTKSVEAVSTAETSNRHGAHPQSIGVLRVTAPAAAPAC